MSLLKEVLPTLLVLTAGVTWVLSDQAGAASVPVELPSNGEPQERNNPGHADREKNILNFLDNHPSGAFLFNDCAEYYPLLYWSQSLADGVYNIKPRGVNGSFPVYCDMTTDLGGWTVIQSRFNGYVNFFRRWNDYKNGFGNVSMEHWLGLEKIHKISVQEPYELRVDLEDWEGNTAYAVYDGFRLSDESDLYRLNLGTFSGTAGDSLIHHNQEQFTTSWSDNDADSANNCAERYGGGWWFHSCMTANLNGPYYRPEFYKGASDTGFGIQWYSFQTEGNRNLKATKMMIRPTEFKQRALHHQN